jgi:hypothetical protein
MTHSALYIAAEAKDVSVGGVLGGDFFRFFLDGARFDRWLYHACGLPGGWVSAG